MKDVILSDKPCRGSFTDTIQKIAFKTVVNIDDNELFSFLPNDKHTYISTVCLLLTSAMTNI